ncbi:MAG: hypothetical protein EBE86_014355 [Hormoscilla sp. GUM202]|nr:hypothetical protein [Hormoscilla sp. GUM202]
MMVPVVFAFSAGAYLFSGIVGNLVSQIPEEQEYESSNPSDVKLVNLRMTIAWPAWVIKEIMAGDRSK